MILAYQEMICKIRAAKACDSHLLRVTSRQPLILRFPLSVFKVVPFPSEGPSDSLVKKMPNVPKSVCVGLGIGAAILLLWQRRTHISGFFCTLIYRRGLSFSFFKTSGVRN
jgi:hypothetical protein